MHRKKVSHKCGLDLDPVHQEDHTQLHHLLKLDDVREGHQCTPNNEGIPRLLLGLEGQVGLGGVHHCKNGHPIGDVIWVDGIPMWLEEALEDVGGEDWWITTIC